MKRPIGFLPAVLASAFAAWDTARADTSRIHRSGTIVSVLDEHGAPGGSCVLDHGLAIGDTYAGTLPFDPDKLAPGADMMLLRRRLARSTIDREGLGATGDDPRSHALPVDSPARRAGRGS